MIEPNFQTMSQVELRNYVLAHLENIEAFYALVDRLKEKPGRTLSEAEITRLPKIWQQRKQGGIRE
jgi:hypothetical protein